MLSRLVASIRAFFSRKPVRLAIVRRYQDANGHYVGELYIEQTRKGVTAFNMIGASLDSCSMDSTSIWRPRIDTDNDFLAPMGEHMIRVGAMLPKDNDSVRKMVASLPRRHMTLVIENRFMTDLKPAGPLAFNLMTKMPEQIVQEFDKPC